MDCLSVVPHRDLSWSADEDVNLLVERRKFQSLVGMKAAATPMIVSYLGGKTFKK